MTRYFSVTKKIRAGLCCACSRDRNVYKPSAIFIVTYGSNILVFLFLVMRKTPRKHKATLHSVDKYTDRLIILFFSQEFQQQGKRYQFFRNRVVGNSPQQKHADVKDVFILKFHVKHGSWDTVGSGLTSFVNLLNVILKTPAAEKH